MNTTFIICAAALALILSAWATLGAIRDDALTTLQKRHQVVLAWILPILGPAILISVRYFMSRSVDPSPGDSSLVVEDRHYISKGYFFRCAVLSGSR
jgi:hypothetical protein